MKEIIVILVVIICYIFFSYKMQGVFLKLGKFTFISSCFLYLIVTYVFFELTNRIEIFLRNRKIYFEFGHSDIVMLEVMIFCFLIALINICVAIFRTI